MIPLVVFFGAEWKSPALECPRAVSKACMPGGNVAAVAAVDDYIHGNISWVHGSSQLRVEFQKVTWSSLCLSLFLFQEPAGKDTVGA